MNPSSNISSQVNISELLQDFSTQVTQQLSSFKNDITSLISSNTINLTNLSSSIGKYLPLIFLSIIYFLKKEIW